MSKKINGETYWWVDTICVYEVLYDVYMNDRDQAIYIPFGTIDD